MNISPEVALDRLKAGNDRFVNGLRSIDSLTSLSKRIELATAGQKPFSIILTCSDSRVPAEIIFDVGLGDLFVVRVAGNIASASVIASVEYAAVALNVQLCVVLGHSQCGAVQAAIEYEKSGKCVSDNIRDLIDQILPSVNAGLSHKSASAEDLIEDVTRRNVTFAASGLLEGSPLIRDLVANDKFAIIGATYDLKSGRANLNLPIKTDKTSAPGQRVKNSGELRHTTQKEIFF